MRPMSGCAGAPSSEPAGGREPTLTVLVDARNVLRSQWPNMPEQQLVEACCAWAAARRFRAVVVFDGKAPGALVGERRLGFHCVVVGAGAESADAWLKRTAAECHAEERRYWLVTSDRALRAVAGKHADRTIGGGTFARELRSPP
jgi:predicted RNA-binding protein with PIN domain